MIRRNAREISYTEVDFRGQKALFTECRVDRSTIPRPFRKFDVRHDDTGWAEPASITYGVMVNYMGALITTHDILPPENGEPIYLEPGELDLFSGRTISLQEFARENNIKIKPVQQMER